MRRRGPTSRSTFADAGRSRGLSRCRFTSVRSRPDLEVGRTFRSGERSRPGLSDPAQEESMAYPAGFKYTKDHEWVELSGDRAKVGITEYAQQQLGDVVYIELPTVGAKLKQGQSFGTI